MNKQAAKTEKTRAALVDAFWTLYKERPINKITIKDITDKAGYYRSTFYFYFSDVYDVLEKIEADILSAWENMILGEVETEEQEDLQRVIAAFYEKYGEYMSVLLSPTGDPMFLKQIKDTMRPKYFSYIKAPEVEDMELSLIFEFAISAMLAVFTEWYRNSDKISAQQTIRLLDSLRTEGVMTVIQRHMANIL